MKKIIKASAGTGKTYSLALEYIKELILGTDFRKIYVMTFTKKATSEIRERVLLFLEEISEGTEAGDEILENIRKSDPGLTVNQEKMKIIYKDIIYNKDKIKIYTIDSFIKIIFDRIVAEKKHIYTYNTDNDENKEVIENVLAELISNRYHMEKVKSFLLKERRRNLEEYEELIDQLIKNRWKFEFIGNERKTRKKYKVETADLLYETEKLLLVSDEVIMLSEFSREEVLKEPFLSYNSFLDSNDKEKYFLKNIREFLKATSDIIWNGRKIKGNKYKEAAENFKEEYRNYKKILAKYIFNEEIISYEKDYFEISDIIFGIYDQIRFSEKSFNNSDRTIYTYKLLMENNRYINNGKVTEEFYDFFGNEIETVFIDEFQDTSVLQWRILRAIVEGSKNAVIVGDAKQSIYGWRDGEKKLFENLENILDGEVNVNSLAKTYRTKEKVMIFLNKFFNNINDTWNYEEVEYNSPEGYVELNAYNNDDPETDTIEEILRDITASLKENGNYRNTAVIARKNSELANIAAYLETNKIPFILESNKTLKEYEETEAVFYLFHFLVYKDFISLVKFLRSSFMDINAEDLRYILENKYKIQGYLEGRSEKTGVLEDFFKKLVIAEKMEYTDKVRYIFENFNIIKEEKSSIVYKNILYLYNLMLKFESMEDFLSKTEENKELLSIQGLNETNAVILTTIHKSKGLEYNTVYYLIDSSGKKGNNRGGLEFITELDKTFTKVEDYIIFNSRNRGITELLDEYRKFPKNSDLKEEDEKINNLYVALTRAKSNLYIFYYTGKKGFRNDNLENALYKASGLEIEEVAGSFYTDGVYQNKEEESKRPEKKEINIKKYFIENKKYDKIVKSTKSLEIENSRKEGLAIHYYFENIKYAGEEERYFARSQVFQKYGNMLGKSKLEEIFKRADNFIFGNKELFYKTWEVFNEFEITDGVTGEVFRIDKLLLDRTGKKAVILDFKSGEIHNQEQILKYEKILKEKLPDYDFRKEFIRL